jgi:ATP-dependent DNA ligase
MANFKYTDLAGGNASYKKYQNLTPNFTIDDIKNRLNTLKDAASKQTIEAMHNIGHQAVIAAYKHGDYKDRTGKLRASLGYAIFRKARNGITKLVYFMNIGGGISADEIQKFTSEVSTSGSEKFVLIVFAGMEYAVYVEALGYFVLTGAIEGVDTLGIMQEELAKSVSGREFTNHPKR